MSVVRFQVSPIGRSWLSMALLLLFIGWLRGINIVLLLAYVLLVFWSLNFFLAGRGLGRLRVRRRVKGPLFAATPFAVSFEVANLQRRDLIGVRLADRGAGPAAAGFFIVRLRGGETTCFQRELSLPRRGLFRWQALNGWSGYPFGLVRRSVELAPAEDSIVLPQLGRLHRGRLRRFLTCEAPLADGLRPVARPMAAARAEFHGLRPFRSGDSFRSIHWRTSARRGEWMVREFENAATDNLVLIFDPWIPETAGQPPSPQVLQGRGALTPTPLPRVQGRGALDSGLLFEDLVSLAATICWEWCRQRGDQFALAVGGPRPVVWNGITGPEHARRMLEGLAVLESSAVNDYEPLTEAIVAGKLPPGPMLVVGLRAKELAPLLATRLHRSAAYLDAAALDGHDFYERPGPHAA